MINSFLFKTSVIIPVYNGEAFIKKAINSASIFDVVQEIIVIEDGSTDSTLNIIKEIERQDPKVKVYQHDYGANKGRSASRNLGILKSSCPFIAFLDADDFYLPNRFEKDIEIFTTQDDADGVYNAIGTHFYSTPTAEERKRWKLISVWETVKPEELFASMTPIGNKGFFSGDGLTVKRSIFDKVGFFNTKLDVAEDTELYIKMAAQCRLVGGQIKEPVAMRGVHDNNVFKGNNDLYTKNRKLMYESLLSWFYKNNMSSQKIQLLWKSLWKNRKTLKKTYIKDMTYWCRLTLKHPNLLLSKQTYKPLIRK